MILLCRVSFLFNEMSQFPMQWGPVLYTEEQLGLADTIVFGDTIVLALMKKLSLSGGHTHLS